MSSTKAPTSRPSRKATAGRSLSAVTKPVARSAAAPTFAPTVANDEAIVVKGARVHNLKNIDAFIPRDRFVVITGPSGSGKSSLAFDTIYAEGQRRYVESLSAYARQFLDQLGKPDV